MRARGVSAFVTIQEGCDRFCTFCVVPYTRGAEFSRPVAKIVAEVRTPCRSGGMRDHADRPERQCLPRSGTGLAPLDAWSPARMHLPTISGIARLRYTTSHPCDMDASLIAAHGDLPSVMPYLHLPVQSGSNRILAAMNRRHSRAETTSTSSHACARRGRHGVLLRFHRRLPGRTRCGLSRRRSR